MRKNASTMFQVSDEVRMTLVDRQRGNFHCVPIQHPENPQNRSYNLLHFVVPAFGSTDFRLAIVSNVEL